MIYVVGSLNMDWSALTPKVPRAGETVTAQSVLVSPGGKGANQAAAIAKLGGACAMIGKVGRDDYGDRLLHTLQSYGVDTAHVTRSHANTGMASIWVHKGNNRIVLDRGANGTLTNEDVDEGLAKAAAGDVLLAQLEVPLPVVEHALCLGKRKGMVTLLNPAPAVPLSEKIWQNAEVILPNETETQILTGVMPDCEVNIALAVKKMRSLGAANAVITLGKTGSAVAVGNEIALIPAYKVKAVDTTAAGDTYVGALAVRLHGGDDIVSAARFATAASGLKVTRRGACEAIPTAEEVTAFIGKQ